MPDFLHNDPEFKELIAIVSKKLGIDPDVKNFIGSADYNTHKEIRFRGADRNMPLNNHPALLLPDKELRGKFEERYKRSSKLYYRTQPEFEQILAGIKEHIHLL